MEMRKKEEREALHSEKGRIEKKNELNYKEQRIVKKNIAKERRRKRKKERRRDLEKEPIHTKREIERRKEIREEGRRMASFLESISSTIGRKEERREASVSAIPGFTGKVVSRTSRHTEEHMEGSSSVITGNDQRHRSNGRSQRH